MNVKRYTPRVRQTERFGPLSDMEPDPKGCWVDIDDYQRVEQERDDALNERDAAHAAADRLDAQCRIFHQGRAAESAER